MRTFDWILTLLPFVLVFVIAICAKRYVKSVADFMSGNRSAGRYLLAIAGGELQAGAVVFVASFEVISRAGFTLGWWGWLSVPVWIFLGISGFVTFRYRETRAMTLAQFFEIRYSKSFRTLTGVLGFVAGICNFGIIPAVGARCVAYFLGFPETVVVGGFTVPTYIPLMALFLAIALVVVLSGGVITLMITNCIEGIISQLAYLVIIFALLCIFSWSQISDVLGNRPPGQSFLNPFDSGSIKDFNIWYVLMGMFLNAYGTMAWQNAGAYNSAAFSAHEGRMGGVLGRWREMGKGAVVALMGVCALTFLHHPDFASQLGPVTAAVHQIADPKVQSQMEMPIALSQLLPVGIKGVVCAIFLMGIFGGDATHLHSWGSIFVQDVLVPRRKKPFGPKQHLWALRLSIVGVAVFAFLFGCLFRQTEYIFMWWSVTTAVFVGGAGAAIIGGLYWKKGTTAGAFSALITGTTLAGGGILIKQFTDGFPLNGAQISFFTALTSITVYVVVSLLTCREEFNMDRMLHRGKYAAIKAEVGDAPLVPQRRVWLGRLIGLDENFTLGDKWIASTLFGWSILWVVVLAVGTIWNLAVPWPVSAWSVFWEVVGIGLPILLAVVTGLWFTWGGIRDTRDLFRRLRNQKVNPLDDGTVVDNQNLDELIAEEHAHGSRRHDNLVGTKEKTGIDP
ncbi:MAG: hypothetical protein WC003_07800 [Terrimicrobiaceae bacterium]